MNTTPQGWYRDPADRARVRWFDGQAWTANSQAAPAPGSAPLPPPAPAGAPDRTRAAVATLPARAQSVPNPRPPVPMVIPQLEADEPYEDEQPVAEPVAQPVAQVEATAAVEPHHGTPAAPQTYGQPAVPAAPYDHAYPSAASGAPAQGFSPSVPTQFRPEPSAPVAAAGTSPYRSEFAPAPTTQPDLPPYVAQPQAPAPYPAAPVAWGQPQAPFGQPGAAYPQPATGAVPGFAPPGTAWQGGGGPWAQPTRKKNTGKVVLIVLASVLGGLVLLGILAAIAIPVFLDQRATAQVAAAGLDTVTCEQVAEAAVRISAQDAAPLVSMADVSLVQDDRSTLRIPGANDDPVFVLSCAGTGTRPDGTTAPVTAELYVDSTNQQLVAYTWAQ